MASVGIRELKHETSAILRRVREHNETIDVTHHGKVVARLVPVEPDVEIARRTKAVWRDLDELAKEIGARSRRRVDAVKALGRGRLR
jgi:prevent-host-death family protein